MRKQTRKTSDKARAGWKDKVQDLRDATVKAVIERMLSDNLGPWDVALTADIRNGGPVNVQTGLVYQGFNWIWLAMHGQQYWAGAKQWHTVGARVKAEYFLHGVEILIPRIVTREETNGDKRTILVGFKSGMVYSANMVDGWTPPEIKVNPEALTPNATADGIVSGMANAPTLEHTTRDCGSYSPMLDKVSMPHREWFKSAARYYKTLMHEYVHSTGHASRLDRRAGMDCLSGVHAYSREELVAEFGAAMLVARCGFHNETLDNSAAYIKHWAQYIGDNPNMLFEAAADAQKAVNAILGVDAYGNRIDSRGKRVKGSETAAA